MEDNFGIVKNTKAYADEWRHFGLKKRKSDSTIVDGVAVCFISKSRGVVGGGGRMGEGRGGGGACVKEET